MPKFVLPTPPRPSDIAADILLSMQDRTPLYVRLPTPEAEKLDRAAFELKTPKQDLVAGLVARYGDVDTLRRVTVETTDDGLSIGHASFRAFPPPDVLTVAQLAEWLDVDAQVITDLAEDGKLPGRRLGGEWRFARDAVLDWLARR
jgi:excisionase family DNA binding protein